MNCVERERNIIFDRCKPWVQARKIRKSKKKRKQKKNTCVVDTFLNLCADAGMPNICHTLCYSDTTHAHQLVNSRTIFFHKKKSILVCCGWLSMMILYASTLEHMQIETIGHLHARYMVSSAECCWNQSPSQTSDFYAAFEFEIIWPKASLMCIYTSHGLECALSRDHSKLFCVPQSIAHVPRTPYVPTNNAAETSNDPPEQFLGNKFTMLKSINHRS